MTEPSRSKIDDWLKRAEEALKRATDAVGDAWKATEGQRREAWETAKRAAEQATDALDRGIEAAKERMDKDTPPAAGDEATESTTSADTQHDGDGDAGAETAEPPGDQPAV